jgi:hypothetical protein
VPKRGWSVKRTVWRKVKGRVRMSDRIRRFSLDSLDGPFGNGGDSSPVNRAGPVVRPACAVLYFAGFVFEGEGCVAGGVAENVVDSRGDWVILYIRKFRS